MLGLRQRTITPIRICGFFEMMIYANGLELNAKRGQCLSATKKGYSANRIAGAIGRNQFRRGGNKNGRRIQMTARKKFNSMKTEQLIAERQKIYLEINSAPIIGSLVKLVSTGVVIQDILDDRQKNPCKQGMKNDE